MKKLLCILMCLLIPLPFASCREKKAEITPAETHERKQKPAFPLKIDGGKIIIEKIESVDGIFVEKGGNDKVKGVAAAVIRNAGDKMIDYADISFRVNQYERADFSVGALPAGESAIVMEKFARAYSADDAYEPVAENTDFTYCEERTQVKGIEIKTDGADITVKNNTDKTLSPRIVYKYYKDGMYYGGIAFTGTFKDVAAGGSVTKTSDRFTKDCRIVNIIV